MKSTLRLMVFALASIGLTFSACDTEPDPGVAEIQVIDEDGISQSGVKVRLFCTEPNCVVSREGSTNSLGIYTTSFELPVVLRVRAVRYDTTITTQGLPPNQITTVKVDSLCGNGFIQVENDEIASETITILECN
jgi:hypothetical protein